MPWFALIICGLVAMTLVVTALGASTAAGRADDQLERLARMPYDFEKDPAFDVGRTTSRSAVALTSPERPAASRAAGGAPGAELASGSTSSRPPGVRDPSPRAADCCASSRAPGGVDQAEDRRA